MNLLAMLFSLSVSLFAQAQDCPNYRLECQLQKVNSKGGYETVKAVSAAFAGVNQDEPSEEPNACEASASFSAEDTGLGHSLHAVVKENLEAFLYVGKEYGALDPQFSVNALPGQPFTLYFKQQQMICVVK